MHWATSYPLFSLMPAIVLHGLRRRGPRDFNRDCTCALLREALMGKNYKNLQAQVRHDKTVHRPQCRKALGDGAFERSAFVLHATCFLQHRAQNMQGNSGANVFFCCCESFHFWSPGPLLALVCVCVCICICAYTYIYIYMVHPNGTTCLCALGAGLSKTEGFGLWV